jgi:hypothetical protein
MSKVQKMLTKDITTIVSLTLPSIQTVIDFCRNCHIVTHFVLDINKGFKCPICKCIHNLSNSSIPVIVNRTVLDHKVAENIKRLAHFEMN